MSAAHQDDHFVIEFEGVGLKLDTLWYENEPRMAPCLRILTPGRKYRETDHVSICGEIEKNELIYVKQEAEVFMRL